MKIFHFALPLLVFCPTPAAAQERPPEVHVSYADLDLRTEAGVQALDRRLAGAFRKVCANRHGTTNLTDQFAERRCIAQKTTEVASQRTRALAARTASSRLAGVTR